ncbi:MAG TPA: NrfD/PsrC family molybdoenzyme membrane anchor subunit, partial [Vicinamibacterales bacterium]|nr:NrfD/PsrC family molybdoenzyme membrane anchor subunit [Vicinamibacterales bacterium]
VGIDAILATSYTGFLFAQGLGRDLWQGPHAAIHLVAQSGGAGAASLLIAALFVPPQDAGSVEALTWVLGSSVAAHLMILLFDNVFAPSPTRHHELALETIRRGPYARLFWGVAITAGGVVPLLLVLATTSLPLGLEIASVLALAGSAAWEYIWVEAGQSVPLS